VRGWSQAELARRAGIPRTTVSAIEGRRLTPSVTAALALAGALECSVEELFGRGGSTSAATEPPWAWSPRSAVCRYWEAEVSGQSWRYPVEGVGTGLPHDGVWEGGIGKGSGLNAAPATLVLACCDPAAALLAAEYAQATGFRLLVLSRGGGEALELLKRGVIHLAGVHRATTEQPARNLEAVRSRLGTGYRLIRAAHWQEGLAVSAREKSPSAQAVFKLSRRWALREPGSAARECLDESGAGARTPGRIVSSHAAVAAAVRDGWADAGVCVQLTAEDAGLNFIPLRTEALDFCFPDSLSHDPRLLALLRVLRSRAHRRLISELPGYAARETGDLLTL
jgi:molybdate-binding protein/transcriptional regulator with XRE-family HTH domain